jgi:ComF family protein
VPRFALPWSDPGAMLSRVERWLLPGECLLCRWAVEPTPADVLICAPCRNRWSVLPHPQCPRCGQPETPGIACRLCSDWPRGLMGVRSAVWLDPPAREAVHLLKYSGWWRVAEVMAATMRRTLPLPVDATLVPIPLGATRQRSRGYNQSAVLAESLGRLLDVPVALHALSRRRETTTQTALTPEERRANLAGAFVADGVSPARPVLVDDVFTTGATLAEAAAALLAAGAGAVSGITFARAARPLADAAAGPTHQRANYTWRRA